MENERQSRSPSASSFPPAAGQPVGLGLGLDQASVSVSQPYSSAPSPAEYQYNNPDFLPTQQQAQQQQQRQPSYVQSPFIKPDPGCGDPDSMEFVQQSQAFMAPEYGGPDFSLFQSSPGHGDAQFDQPIFESESLSPSNLGANMSPQAHQSPTPPHHLGGGGSRHNSASPSFSHQQQQYIHQNGGGHSHSRNVSASLGPEAALMQNHITDWSRPQFQSHRRSLSEFSDVSSAVPSPHLGTHDSFEDAGHSPLQQATDPGMVMGIGNFSLSDPTPSMGPASPSRSPAPSPRMLPQSMSDANAPNLFGLGVSNGYGGSQSYPSVAATGSAESFPQLQPPPGSETPQMAPPAINIDFAPSSTRQNTFEPSKSLDQDSLTPPDRGRPLSRRRAVTDPSNRGASVQGQLSPLMSPDMSGPSAAGSSRSLSPLDREEATSSTRRRQSTSSVPNNIIALRLADPEYQAAQDTGGITKRAQKHPATFQCTLCPKRFTRAYNLRSHLRTHTDERPFVCTVCAKAFARQHDRKRHESLHSGEKKFICKGELKDGGSWGCGRRFARADALGRHFRSESGRACIASLLREETEERQRYWHEQRLQNMGHNLGPQVALDAPAYPMDPNFVLPAALLAQYPALAQMNWSASGLDDESKSSFDAASDYEDGEDTGYVSGPGAFGSGEQSYSEMGYASDYSAR